MNGDDPGYGFVPLPPAVRRVERPEARWDRRVPGTVAGHIDLELTAEQPIHVGSGSKYAARGEVVQRGARIRGGLGIPGSTLKGVLRARYEAITRSCAIAAPKVRCDYKIRSSSEPDIKRARLLVGHAIMESNCTPTRACPACALFGCMSLRSRITVTDLVCAHGVERGIARIPERFGPNLHHIGRVRVDSSGRAFEVGELYGRKFGLGRGPAAEGRQSVEVIPSGVALVGQLRLFNVTLAELGGLMVALGCDPPSRLKLGGGKGHGLGRARCKASCELTGDAGASLDPNAWREALVTSEDHWSSGEQRLTGMHSGAC